MASASVQSGNNAGKQPLFAGAQQPTSIIQKAINNAASQLSNPGTLKQDAFVAVQQQARQVAESPRTAERLPALAVFAGRQQAAQNTPANQVQPVNNSLKGLSTADAIGRSGGSDSKGGQSNGGNGKRR